jgi:hypothetical protein
MIKVFQGLTEICLKNKEAVEQWNSALCGDGTPMEFSVVIDSRAAVSVAYSVDPPARRDDVDPTGRSLRTWANLVIPYGKVCSETIDELLKRFPAIMGDLREAYAAFGARYAPGKPQLGRLYFKTDDIPVEQVWAFLSAHLDENDMKILQRPPLSQGVLLGIGYDFHPAGLARVKVYVLIDRLSREASRGMLQDVLGEKGVEIQRIVDKISRQKNPFWIPPHSLVSMGFQPGANSRNIKINLSARAWEWESFTDVWPVVSFILNEWKIPVRSEVFPSGSGESSWRFVPTWLSIDASKKTESLSIYFKPLRKFGPSLQVLSGEEEGNSQEQAVWGEGSPDGVKIFSMMFAQLVGTDIRASLSGSAS